MTEPFSAEHFDPNSFVYRPACASSSERRYLFMHVPKTAGSAFRNIISNNFREASAIENPLLSTQIYSQKQIDWLFSTYPYRFYSGHVFRLKPALNACDGQLQLIAFVRDPIDKAISSYYYMRNREMTAPDHPVRIYSLAELCKCAKRGWATQGNGFDDSQLDWLVGECHAQLSTVKDAVASGQLLLFPTESFDSALVLLQSIFPWDFSSCAYASRVNITSYDADRDNMAERNHAEKLPWVSDDRALHKLACENLEQLIRKTFASNADMDSALANFRTQCTFACESNFDLSNHGKARILRRIKRRINEWIK